MADYGFKVSRPGYDVKTATSQQLSYTSKNFLLKTYLTGSITLYVPADATIYTTSLSHNLGYRPAFIVWTNIDSGGSLRYTCPGASLTQSNCYVYANNNTFYFKSKNLSTLPGVAYTTTFVYYIFYDKGGA